MTSGFYKYAQLVKRNTDYAKRMERLSNRIFGNPVRTTHPDDLKNVVQYLASEPNDKQDWIRNWYPRHRETHKLAMALREYGLFRDEHEDFKEEMIRQRALRGKVQRKPGEGGKKAKISG